MSALQLKILNYEAFSYTQMLRDNVIPQLESQGLLETVWWQQDGAPPHYARTVRNYLGEVFNKRWISRGGPIEWTPRSPDLNPLDFYGVI